MLTLSFNYFLSPDLFERPGFFYDKNNFLLFYRSATLQGMLKNPESECTSLSKLTLRLVLFFSKI